MKFPEEQPRIVVSEEQKFGIMMDAQREILEMGGGDEHAADWVAANAERFMKVINDPQNDFYNRLSNDETHAVAIKELKNLVYN